MAKSTSIVKAIIVLAGVLFLSFTYSLFTKGAIYRIFFYGRVPHRLRWEALTAGEAPRDRGESGVWQP